jgi:hypothetical protein
MAFSDFNGSERSYLVENAPKLATAAEIEAVAAVRKMKQPTI